MTWTLSDSGNKSLTIPNTCTFSNGSPTITMPNTFAAGDKVTFATTSALPTNFVVGTVYFVISTGLSASAFEVSATSGGSAISAGSAGTGTQSVATVEEFLATDTNNATFIASFDATAMILNDCVECHLYSIMLSGGNQLQAWKGSWSNPQINASKQSPPIASDQSLQMSLKCPQANAYSATCTFSNGSANVTLANNPLVYGDVVQFSTTGSLPTNFAINTNYFVITTGSPFTVSATYGGSAISAGSAGSGTQTAKRVGHTFPWKILRI